MGNTATRRKGYTWATSLTDYLSQRTLRNPSTGCLEWQGLLTDQGYGDCCTGKWSKIHGKSGAHQLAYIAAKGDIPVGLLVMHTCDNRRCCDPEHLVLGTEADNIQDAARKGRLARGETHHNTSLTTEDIKEIRAVYPNLASYKLADLFNVSRTTIMNIVKHKTWKHV